MHRAIAGDDLHEVGATAECAYREAVAERLRHDRDIGHDAEEFLGTAGSDAEARDHLVEDQDGADLRRERTCEFEVAGPRRDHAGVARKRLHDHPREAVAGIRHDLTQCVRVIPLDDHHVRQRRRRLARSLGQRRGEMRRPRQDRVQQPAVVVAGELDHERPARGRARQPDRGVHRLRSGEPETHALERRHDCAEPFRELELGSVLRANLLYAAGRLRNRRRHARVSVPEDDRPVTAGVVDVLVAVLIYQVGASGLADEQRNRPLVHPEGRRDAAGE